MASVVVAAADPGAGRSDSVAMVEAKVTTSALSSSTKVIVKVNVALTSATWMCSIPPVSCTNVLS